MKRPINPEAELKTLAEIAAHFPRRTRDAAGNVIVGVSRSTINTHLRHGRLQLEKHELKGRTYYYVSVEDQLADLRTWRLGKKYKAKRIGRPSDAERIGLK